MNPLELETNRLVVRPFIEDDLQTIHRILDQTFGDGSKVADASALQARRSWLEWSILSQQWLPRMEQTPYGDRAIVLKSSGQVIGSVGYVPLRDVYWQIPELRIASRGYTTPEIGLFWVIDPPHQKQGYATEAAQVLIDEAAGVEHDAPWHRQVRAVKQPVIPAFARHRANAVEALAQPLPVVGGRGDAAG